MRLVGLGDVRIEVVRSRRRLLDQRRYGLRNPERSAEGAWIGREHAHLLHEDKLPAHGSPVDLEFFLESRHGQIIQTR